MIQRRLFCAALLSAAIMGTGCAIAPAPSFAERTANLLRRPADASSPVLVVAHRGCWHGSAENSLAAIEACIALGVDVVELDVRRTADGVLVLMHDSTVDRTTNGRGRVEELTLAQVSALRLRTGLGGANADLTTEIVPTFEAAMRAARGRVLVNLDAKSDVYDDAFVVLERTGTVDQVIMKRRVTPGEASLAEQQPFDRVLAMPIVDQVAGTATALLAHQSNGHTPAVEAIFTDLSFLDDLRRTLGVDGPRIWVNTLQPIHAAGLTDERALADPEDVWGVLIDRGVTLIQTDEPEALIRHLRARGRHASPRTPMD